jgi:DNA-3-methyladenine glycosylase
MTTPFDASLPAVELARDLLGRTLVRVDADGRRRAGVIVETEAYPGGEDLASHSRGGHRTPRNESMYLAGGHLYVYLIYGMHHCVNVVSGPADSGEAVLIRAIRPTEGIERMREVRPGHADRDLARGPGRLAAALEIDRSFDTLPLTASSVVRIEGAVDPGPVVTAGRIGVERSGAWAATPWRFLVGDPRWWSRPPAGGRAR